MTADEKREYNRIYWQKWRERKGEAEMRAYWRDLAARNRMKTGVDLSNAVNQVASYEIDIDPYCRLAIAVVAQAEADGEHAAAVRFANATVATLPGVDLGNYAGKNFSHRRTRRGKF